MARKTEAQRKAERAQLLKEYTQRRKSIRQAELKELRQGGIQTKSFVPEATASQIKNVNIRKLRSIVAELKPITARVVRTGFEYRTETGTISATEQFHRMASERARRAAETRQGYPPELRKLRKAVLETTEPRLKEALRRRFEQEKQEFINEKKRKEKQHKFDEEQKLNMITSYINADKENKKYISESYQRLYNERIEDYVEGFSAFEEAENKNNMMNVYLDALLDNDIDFAKSIARRWFNLYNTDINKENLNFYSGNAVEEYLTKSQSEKREEQETEEQEQQEQDEYDGFNGEDFNYTGNDYRTGEQYASYDLDGYLSYLDEITKRIADGFYNTRGGLRRSKGRRGWTPYDFDEDRNDLLTMWRNTIDRFSNNDADRKDLIDYIKRNEDRISLLVEAIEFDSDFAIYRHHYSELYTILNYDAPTVEDLINFGDMEDWEEV